MGFLGGDRNFLPGSQHASVTIAADREAVHVDRATRVTAHRHSPATPRDKNSRFGTAV